MYICLIFDEEGSGAEVKGGFGGGWCPGNVVGSSGFFGSENERIRMSTQVWLEAGG